MCCGAAGNDSMSVAARRSAKKIGLGFRRAYN